MGTWGTKLYEDDTALDVKAYFEEHLRKKEPVEEITARMIEENKDLLQDPYDAPIFWFALADTQWNWGRLLPDVKEQALWWIAQGGDLRRWQENGPANVIARQKELEALQQKLLSPLPPPKRIVKSRCFQCEWKIGDVFAYRLESDRAKEQGLYGRYFLIRKVGEGIWHPKHVVPIVHVKLTSNGKLPTCLEEFDQAEYVQTWLTSYEDRFFPIDGRRPREDILEKSKLKYEVDEYGYLPQFRIYIIAKSKKELPDKLIYIGNFPDVKAPEKEFVPHSELNICVTFWKHKSPECTFENELIKKYCLYNLRQLSIYAPKNHS